MRRLFTSESVTEGHPDKVCDQISDAVLDSILANDPTARVACETFCTTGMVTVMGEITTSCYVDIPAIARQVINEIGYDSASQGFDGNTCAVMTAIDEQSPDIAMGVDNSLELKDGQAESQLQNGAGDQGMMFGYACNETPIFMPLAIQLANELTRRLTDVRKAGRLSYLRPDGKSQVTVEYVDGKLSRVEAVVISAQHDPDVDIETLRQDIQDTVINVVIPDGLMDWDTKIYINPTGRFVLGGPAADTGLTGRKIIADTYGGYARHGGGAFSGKDPTKVDRSAAYMARYIAKHIVAAGLADKCEIQLSYAIGVAQPVSIMVDTFGTNKIPEEVIQSFVIVYMDLRPGAIIKRLQLRNPIYGKTAAYGHFGREEFPWERLDEKLLADLKALL